MPEHEFAVWAPKPDVVRLDVEGTLHPMERAEDMGGICHLCGDKHRPSFICEICVGKGCDPFEEKLKRMESRARYMAEWA